MSNINKPPPAKLRALAKKHGSVVHWKGEDSYSDIYSSKAVVFGLARLELVGDQLEGSLNKGDWEELLHCREELCNWYADLRHDYEGVKAGPDFSTVLLFSNVNVNNMRSGIRLLNTLERQALWGLSWLCNVAKDNKACVVVGSRYWTSAVPLLSLYSLLLRSIAVTPVDARERLNAYVSRVVATKRPDWMFFEPLLKAHPDLIRIVVKHHRKLFGPNWWDNAKELNDFQYQDLGLDGISYLCELATLVKEIRSEASGKTLSLFYRLLFDKESLDYEEEKRLFDWSAGSTRTRSLFDRASGGEPLESMRLPITELATLLTAYEGKRVI